MEMIKREYKHLLLFPPFKTIYLFVLLFGCGCAASGMNTRCVKNQQPAEVGIVNQNIKPTEVNDDGSLWRDNCSLSELSVNIKAGKVGDIVTVRIVESSKATNEASTKTGRKSSVSGSMDNFFNLEKRYPGEHPFLNPFAGIKGGIESDFDGSGSTQRSGNLIASMTVMITEILPGGNFKIRGTREVKINYDVQLITLSGVVRPRDISPDNEILSTYISDAKIEYSGTGIINNRQRPGWLAGLLNIIWPF